MPANTKNIMPELQNNITIFCLNSLLHVLFPFIVLFFLPLKDSLEGTSSLLHVIDAKASPMEGPLDLQNTFLGLSLRPPCLCSERQTYIEDLPGHLWHHCRLSLLLLLLLLVLEGLRYTSSFVTQSHSVVCYVTVLLDVALMYEL